MKRTLMLITICLGTYLAPPLFATDATAALDEQTSADYVLGTIGAKIKGFFSKKPPKQEEPASPQGPSVVAADDKEGMAIICEQAEAEGFKTIEDVAKGFAEQMKKECPEKQLKSKDCLYLIRYMGTMQNCFRNK